MTDCRKHMLEGIPLLEQGDFRAALAHFDAALAIRTAENWRADPASAWLVAAAWINRGDCLRSLGELAASIAAYDDAIHAMSFVPLDGNPDSHHRLLLAWINRATACGELSRTGEALGNFGTAAIMARKRKSSENPAGAMLVAMLHSHRAKVFLDVDRAADAWEDSRTAMEILTRPGISDAGFHLKVRAVHCRTLAALLDAPQRPDFPGDWIATAKDAVESSLEIARRVDYRADWLADLVRFGARIYRSCQPQFLGEFIRERFTGSLTRDTRLARYLEGELLRAKADLEIRVRRSSASEAPIAPALEVLRSLQLAERHLSAYPQPA